MKPNTPDHRKTKHLARLLKISRPLVVGTLELFWIAVGKEREDGDITHWTVDSLAATVDWEGEPEHLLQSLITAGFVDDVDSRLVVHDWEEHRPAFIAKRIADRNSKRKQRNRSVPVRDCPKVSERVRNESADVATPTLTPPFPSCSEDRAPSDQSRLDPVEASHDEANPFPPEENRPPETRTVEGLADPLAEVVRRIRGAFAERLGVEPAEWKRPQVEKIRAFAQRVGAVKAIEAGRRFASEVDASPTVQLFTHSPDRWLNPGRPRTAEDASRQLGKATNGPTDCECWHPPQFHHQEPGNTRCGVTGCDCEAFKAIGHPAGVRS